MFSKLQKIKESILEFFIRGSGILIILFVVLIFLFLLKDSLFFFKSYPLKDFFTQKKWLPISEPPSFGIIPLLLGSIYVTFFAIIICVPLGMGCAMFIAEVAPSFLRNILKSFVEILAAIPSVVLGFIGIVWLGPLVKKIFSIPTGMCGFTGSLLLAFMALPTIISISEDALRSVPYTYKEAAFGLGATKWQTLWRVILPAASSGIIAAIMLGIGRVIGETMVVMMVTGNSPIIPSSILEPLRTLTATIASEMGETVRGGLHYFALFSVGLILFIITFIINFLADLFLHRSKK
ncbi:MAG: phosphate ABC transporter permease subunit PstC [Candidatus Omnitrophota bacterium]|nr:MAG: phosphate ABC transporter permease subunit PstC [Candidatus Omnitrophota bacterium]RKY38667.1 MAG: phosphate ABC transporter permease subunit PstC [Candidatus Omnitrophota bacterium]RKY45171.1 MAG: phosphate ABC transporter permease subunit PstC [Candidatus Omnitrophota bacterium]HDN85665.1 phosphate ABC transporter permease subunit PstC [Candidatus Omnitrophota bacterium]